MPDPAAAQPDSETISPVRPSFRYRIMIPAYLLVLVFLSLVANRTSGSRHGYRVCMTTPAHVRTWPSPVRRAAALSGRAESPEPVSLALSRGQVLSLDLHDQHTRTDSTTRRRQQRLSPTALRQAGRHRGRPAGRALDPGAAQRLRCGVLPCSRSQGLRAGQPRRSVRRRLPDLDPVADHGTAHHHLVHRGPRYALAGGRDLASRVRIASPWRIPANSTHGGSIRCWVTANHQYGWMSTASSESNSLSWILITRSPSEPDSGRLAGGPARP